MFHAHKWIVVSAQNSTSRRYGYVQTQVYDTQITIVLYRCSCGEFKTHELMGHWQSTITTPEATP